ASHNAYNPAPRGAPTPPRATPPAAMPGPTPPRRHRTSVTGSATADFTPAVLDSTGAANDGDANARALTIASAHPHPFTVVFIFERPFDLATAIAASVRKRGRIDRSSAKASPRECGSRDCVTPWRDAT